MTTQSKIKKASVALLFSANAVGVVNSAMVHHQAYKGDSFYGPGSPSTLAMTAMAPVTTGAQWLQGKNLDQDIFGNAPVTYMGDYSAKKLSPLMSKSAGIAFSVMSAPGAYVGTVAGMVSGISTKYAHGISTAIEERTRPHIARP